MLPAYTSNSLVELIKQLGMIPESQNTFSNEKILEFINLEMILSQIPSIMEYREEYFVVYDDIVFVQDQSRYKIPERAIGIKIRDVAYVDTSGNTFEMTRISASDKSMFQKTTSSRNIYAFYFEGNDIVICPEIQGTVSGTLRVWYYLKPNNLVFDERVGEIKYFTRKLIIDGRQTAGDTLVLGSTTYTAVATGSVPKGNQFVINANPFTASISLKAQLDKNQQISTIVLPTGTNELTIKSLNPVLDISSNVQCSSIEITGNECDGDTIYIADNSAPQLNPKTLTVGVNFVIDPTNNTFLTAINLAAALAGLGYVISTALNQVIIQHTGFFNIYLNKLSQITDALNITRNGVYVDPLLGIETVDLIPANLATGTMCDLLEAKNGFKTKGKDIPILATESNVVYIDALDMPYDIEILDHIASQHECKIPQIPVDLHYGLAERTTSNILGTLGDKEGLQIASAKIKDIDRAQQIMNSDRAEGAPLKAFNKFSLARIGRIGIRRRY